MVVVTRLGGDPFDHLLRLIIQAMLYENRPHTSHQRKNIPIGTNQLASWLACGGACAHVDRLLKPGFYALDYCVCDVYSVSGLSLQTLKVEIWTGQQGFKRTDTLAQEACKPVFSR